MGWPWTLAKDTAAKMELGWQGSLQSSRVTLTLFSPLTTLFWGQVVTISQLQMLLRFLKYS